MSIKHKIDTARAAVAKSDPWTSGTAQIPSHCFNLFFIDKMDPPRPHLVKLTDTTHPSELEALSASCDQATFGRAHEDVLDESYRKAGKLDLGRFASTFDAAQIFPTIIPYLIQGKDAEQRVEADMHKLNVYDKGSFFRAHKDTPRSERMFGSLVVVFPTPHTGGELVLRHAEKMFTFDSGTILAGSPDKIAFIAFFSDVEHEVLPVTSGHRVTLTYNLYYPDPTSPRLSSTTAVNACILLKNLNVATSISP
ncbi:hypothetical protein E1B28_003738 [Marasmius oreades]|uniref:Fe2OG dioxygenase domain-containing protein n=1 Tax=Marasmius oreades TaxID=181124 RepID=A0A9P7UX31_9AGAR|nr:uncharacterized protein E1B28_003738 [Marasmius oreades]KAG7096291.1 hypothetical protein E1B28_003738 [Marasmius oreades]